MRKLLMRKLLMRLGIAGEFFLPELLRGLEADSFIEPLCPAVLRDNFKGHTAAAEFFRSQGDGIQQQRSHSLTSGV